MPPRSQWTRTGKQYPLSQANELRRLIRVQCAYCKAARNYFPSDLIEIFGDIEVDDLMDRMSCENGKHGRIAVNTFMPTGQEAVGLRIRRLVAVNIKRIPVWRDE